MASQAASSSDFTGLVGWVVDVIAATGPLGVGLLLALDNVLPVLPSEVILPFAGFLAAEGELVFVIALLAATLGSTASAYVYYEFGRRVGPERARSALTRLPLTEDDDLARASEWFDRFGTPAVFFGRFVPLVRSLVSLPAGTQGMGRLRFGVLTAAGSAIWNTAWLGAGYLIGQEWRQVDQYSGWFNGAIVVVAVVLVARYVWQRRSRLPWSR